MGVGSARWDTTAGGLAVVAVLAGVAFLLPWVNQQVPVQRMLPAGTPVTIGAGAVVTPPPGARLDVGRSLSGRLGGTIVLVVPGTDLEYRLRASSYHGSLAAAARHTGQQLQRRGGLVTGDLIGIETAGGLAGRQGGFQPAAATGSTVRGQADGTGRGGRYAVVIVPGPVLVEAFVVGPIETLQREAAAVDATFRSIAAGRRS